MKQNLTKQSEPGEITFADCPIARVAWLTGAAVASDHVEAQGILIAVVESAEALIMFCKQHNNKTCINPSRFLTSTKYTFRIMQHLPKQAEENTLATVQKSSSHLQRPTGIKKITLD